MQISNPVISQYISGTINRNQQADRFPVKPVTIEGQLVDDKENPSGIKTQDTGSNQPEQSSDDSLTQLINPATASQIPENITPQNRTQESIGQSLLIQKKLSDGSTLISQVLSQDDSSADTHRFPYGNRRSFEGVSGGSLVIQKYLNNESPALEQSGSSQKNVDVFI